jgi:hypothetical protein
MFLSIAKFLPDGAPLFNGYFQQAQTAGETSDLPKSSYEPATGADPYSDNEREI